MQTDNSKISHIKNKRIYILLFLLMLCVCAIPFKSYIRRPFSAIVQVVKGQKNVAERIEQFGDVVRIRLTPFFNTIGVPYPPKRMTLVGLKSEKMLEVWVAGDNGEWKCLKSYPILGMSGNLGPKLKEGDMQVPEGIYRLEALNPNSLFHLALRVDYPNQDDRRRGAEDGRSDLGSDIMIHGKQCSIGCLAMGDDAAEDLFVLAALTGVNNVSIILSPVDFRVNNLPENMPQTPVWTLQLYESIKQELKKFRKSK